MDVYINGRFLTQSTTGVQRFAIEVVKKLDELLEKTEEKDRKYRFCLLVPKSVKYNPMFSHIRTKKIGKYQGHLWEQTELPLYTKDNLLINLCNAGPITKRNQISVIHDAAVYANGSNFSPSFRTWYRLMLKLQAVYSKKIVTVSDFSKVELMKHLKLASSRLHVTSEGREHFINLASDQAFIYEKGLDKKPYILAVSSLNPNKNFQSIVKATGYLKSAEINIVIAGGTDPKVFRKEGQDLPDNVIHLGYVSDEELKALYENAFCFVYPSLYEGFGLPPLEAMSAGCPVIMSNCASLPEVGGEAVLYCNPLIPESIAEKVESLMNDKELREQLIKKGLKQAEDFSWEIPARDLMTLIAQP